MANFGDIFLGVTPAGMRSYLKEVFARARGRYSRLVLPCAGRFADAEVAVQAGWPPGDIELSDIGLFQSTLGYTASSQPICELGAQFHDEIEHFNELKGGPNEAGTILVGIKVAQLKSDRYYERRVRDDLIMNVDKYAVQMQGKLDAFREKVGGVNYKMRDVVDHCDKAVTDPGTLLFVSPPKFKGGYTKMFDTHGLVTWNEPKIPEFDPAARDRLLHILLNGNGLSILDCVSTLSPLLEGKYVYAGQAGKRVDFLASNRPEEVERLVKLRPETEIRPVKIPLLPLDHEITEETKVSIVHTKREHALYYRELFAHKLGASRAESYYLMLMDGYLFGVFGMFFDELLRGQSDRAKFTFGFNVPSSRYPHLNRLLMSLVVSEDARRFFQAGIPSALIEIKRFQTTCISTSPEVKSLRGLLKIVERTTRPDGRFQINYAGAFKAWTFRDALRDWLKRMREAQKQTGRDLGVRH